MTVEEKNFEMNEKPLIFFKLRELACKVLEVA